MGELNEVKQVFSSEPFSKVKGPSVEHTTILMTLDANRLIQQKMVDELIPAKERQNLISLHNQILKQINTLSEEDGSLSSEKFDGIISDARARFTEEVAKKEIKLKNHPESAKELQKLQEKYKPYFDLLDETAKMGSEIRKDSNTFTALQKNRLEDNLKSDLENLKVESTRDHENIGRLYQKSLEAHQHARLLLKTNHEIFMGIIKNWAPR